MKQDIIKILDFIELTHKFQQVKRTILVRNEERNENDLEHSYQLAMLAWYIIDYKKLSLNRELVIKYALVHDLIEVYAGDTFIYDDKKLETKRIREQQAVTQLKEGLPEFVELHNLISNYEHRDDRESKFIYALDKLIPLLNIYLDNGRSWKRHKVKLAMIMANKPSKVAISETVTEFFKEFVIILQENEHELFPKL